MWSSIHPNIQAIGWLLPSNTSLSTIVNGVGNVSWVATNTTYAGIPRYYYVYFNTTLPVTPLYGVNNYGQTFNNATTNFSITQSFADYYNHTVCNQTVPYASWWNNNWLFRAGINVTASGTITYDDELIQYANFDFAQLIGEVYGGSLTFDSNSIRLIEFDEYFNTTTRMIPVQFDPNSGYTSKGTLSWVANGKLTPTRARFYYVYFDVNNFGGQKPLKAMQPIRTLSLSTITAGSNYNMSNSKIDISVNNNHIYQVKDLRSGKDLENNLNLGWDLGDWESYGLSWSQFAFQNLQVVAQGPVGTVIVANYNASTYGFYAQEYYTLDYLDDVIQMQIVVTNTGSATLPEGNWLGFYSDWSPGYGTTDTALTAPGYGVGGFNFTGSAFMNTTIDNSSDFVTPGQTALRSLSPSPFAATTVGMQQASWYVEYNTQVNQGVGTIWNPQTSIDQIHTFISEIGDRGTNGANTTREGVMSFRIVPQQLAAGASMSFTFYWRSAIWFNWIRYGTSSFWFTEPPTSDFRNNFSRCEQ